MFLLFGYILIACVVMAVCLHIRAAAIPSKPSDLHKPSEWHEVPLLAALLVSLFWPLFIVALGLVALVETIE